LDYEAAWELISNLIAELRKSGETIPMKVMSDLRAAKTMMEVYKVDKSHSENFQRIEEYLTNLETCLVPIANRKFGKEYIDMWLKKLEETHRQFPKGELGPSKRFPVGVPRESKWIRIEASEKIATEKIKHLARQIGLKSKIQTDGCALVFGEEQKLKQFVKNLAELLREDNKKRSSASR
jgi:hypothetical protein